MKIIVLLVALALAFMFVSPSMKWDFSIGGGRLSIPIGLCLWASLVLSLLGALITSGR